jgi:hypothetical protein
VTGDFGKGERWLRRWVVCGWILLVSFWLSSGETWANEMGCHSFENWSGSQKYFEEKGGSKYLNIDGLDSDRDGLACEELIGFDPEHINPNNDQRPDVNKDKDSAEKGVWEEILSVLKKWWRQWLD